MCGAESWLRYCRLPWRWQRTDKEKCRSNVGVEAGQWGYFNLRWRCHGCEFLSRVASLCFTPSRRRCGGCLHGPACSNTGLNVFHILDVTNVRVFLRRGFYGVASALLKTHYTCHSRGGQNARRRLATSAARDRRVHGWRIVRSHNN